MTQNKLVTHRLVIVGAGPAGLAAGTAAKTLQPLIVEAGSPVGDRHRCGPKGLASGVGGAGLFSDGKFSFWPSASRLWRLDPTYLNPAYSWFQDVLGRIGISTPEPPENAYIPDEKDDLKSYPSVYVSPENRMRIVTELASRLPGIAVERTVDRWEFDDGIWNLHMLDGETVRAERLVFATGRFGPLLLAEQLPSSCMQLGRLEVGIRIEQPSEKFFIRDVPQPDPKVILRDAPTGTEWRTFCCCRDGTVIATTSGELTTASGRADCPPTGVSNIGFNVRFVEPSMTRELWAPLCRRLKAAPGLRTQPLTQLMRDATGPIAEILGSQITASLIDGLVLLMRRFPDGALEEAIAVGPAIEGVALYPRHDSSLATPAPNLWVAGDAAGSFRGLTAALVSGYIAGMAASEGV